MFRSVLNMSLIITQQLQVSFLIIEREKLYKKLYADDRFIKLYPNLQDGIETPLDTIEIASYKRI